MSKQDSLNMTYNTAIVFGGKSLLIESFCFVFVFVLFFYFFCLCFVFAFVFARACAFLFLLLLCVLDQEKGKTTKQNADGSTHKTETKRTNVDIHFYNVFLFKGTYVVNSQKKSYKTDLILYIVKCHQSSQIVFKYLSFPKDNLFVL